MLAARFLQPNAPLSLDEVNDPTPAPGEVVVRIQACGICASDLHFVHGEMPLPAVPPVTMGHEASGIVESVADGVAGWREGDPVAIAPWKACGRCERCIAWAFEDCRDPQVMGIHYDGAFAGRMATPAYTLSRVPDGVEMEHAAVASDAVSTPYAALVDRGALRPGERVGLWGIGGLGTHAVQLARLSGAGFVAAIDPLPAARERALALGADVALDPADDVPSAIRNATAGFGLDLAADLVGNPRAIKQALKSLERGGRVVVVGQSFERLDAGPILGVSFRGVSILGHLGYRKHHLETVLGLLAAGRLDLSASITDRLPLEAVNDGIERLTRKDESIVRLVVRPNG